MIDKSRHLGLQPSDRICKLSSLGSTEDEFNFLFACPAFSELKSNPFQVDTVSNIYSIYQYNFIGKWTSDHQDWKFY